MQFSIKQPEKVEFSISVIIENCAWPGQKLQIQDLLNEVYPKGLIFKMTLFSLIDLDKIMPKNPK